MTKQETLRRFLKIIGGVVGVLILAFLVYFPGRQTPVAFTLATGIGVSHLQAGIDELEEKAINGREFTAADKRFLQNLYTCLAKGGRLTIVLRQSGRMMERYLSRTGEDLLVAPRIFVKSGPVQEQMAELNRAILGDKKQRGGIKDSYSSPVFYMGDPEFFDSFVGLYFGHIIAKPVKTDGHVLVINWRAECPWEWPSYESLFEKHRTHHAQNFRLPNARSILFGSQYCLGIDDGLGGYLVSLGIAKPFLVYSEWQEEGAEGH